MRNNRGVGFGVFLLSVGVIWALMSMGVITWSIINAFFILWPLIFVVIGVNIIFRRNAIVGAIAWVAFLAALVSYSYFVEDIKYKGNGTAAYNDVVIERHADIQKGELKISLGGAGITLDDSNTANLLNAEIQDKNIRYTQNFDNEKASISFFKRQYNLFNFNTGVNNYKNRFHLNNQVVWGIDIDTGAVNGDFDLSGLAVDKLTLDTGASNFEFTFGEKAQNPKIIVNAGASKIDFYVPKAAGVKVKLDGGLNSTNFDGPEWEKKDGYYYTKGFDEAKVQIVMDVNMGVGKLGVYFR